MNDISDLFKLSRLSREEAIDYIKENPDDIFDLITFVANWIVNGWMRRYKRDVK